MHSCNDIHRILEDYLAGELLPSDDEKLKQHLSACDDCRALLELHEELSQMTSEASEPDTSALRAMRSRVLIEISRGGDKESKQPPGRRLPAVQNMLATAAILLLGVFVGNWLAVPQGVDEQLMLNAATRQAKLEKSLNDSWDADLSFTEVSVGDLANGKFRLGFDVCRSVDVTTSLNSPLAGDVLTHAILNPNSIGSRLRAIELAAQSSDPRLTGALLATLRQDPNPTIRIEALAALSGKADSEPVQQAMLAALRDDDSVQVRMLVLDHLVKQALGQESLDAIIRQGDQESNPALFQRARELRTNHEAEDWL